jgi:threonine aldolase
MSEPVVDLRSDTVTRPTPEMRQAMADAEVGDDVFLEDPTVNRLQDRAAQVFGREAGLFVPSGTMGNLTSILAQTERGQEVICEAAGHIYNYEMASMSAIAGVLPRVIETDDGILDWERVEPAIRPSVYYRAQTAMVSVENTHNMAGGTVYPPDVADEICDRAHERGLRVHLDGARIFNAASPGQERSGDHVPVRFGPVLSEQGTGCSRRFFDRRKPATYRTLPADPQDARWWDAPGGRGCRCWARGPREGAGTPS